MPPIHEKLDGSPELPEGRGASASLTETLGLAALQALARLPLRFMQALGGGLGGLAARLPLRDRKVSDLNVRLSMPELTEAECRAVARESLRSTGSFFCEVPAVWHRAVSVAGRVEFSNDDAEILDRAAAQGRGTLLLLPHLGCWEVFNAFTVARSRPLALYRAPDGARRLERILLRSREATGMRMVPASRAGLRPLLAALAENRIVIVLPDQEPAAGHGVHAPFFGVPAYTMTLVRGLLRRTGAAAVYGFAERLPAGRYGLHFSEPPPGLDDDDRVAAATALNLGVEKCVRRLPGQYLWSYKRFATAPPGEPTPYRAVWSRRKLRRNPFRRDSETPLDSGQEVP